MACIEIKNKDELAKRIANNKNGNIIGALSSFYIMDSLEGDVGINLNLSDTLNLREFVEANNLADLDIKADEIEEIGNNLQKLLNLEYNPLFISNGKVTINDNFKEMQLSVVNAINVAYVKTKEFADSTPRLMVSDPMVKKVKNEMFLARNELLELYKKIDELTQGVKVASKQDLDEVNRKISKTKAFISDSEKYLDRLDTQDNFETILAKYNRDVKEANDILAKPKKTLREYNRLKDLSDFWFSAGSLTINALELTEYEKENEELLKSLNQMVAFADRLDGEIFKLGKDFVVELTNEQFTTPLEKEQILGFNKDDNTATSYLAGIHKSKNPIIQAIGNLIQKARDLALFHYKKEEQEINEAYDKVASKVNNNFERFIQKDNDGDMTYNLADQYSYKYWNIINAFDYKTDKGKSAAAKFYSDNVIVVRFDWLFDEQSKTVPGEYLAGISSDENKIQHIAKLKEQLGEQGFADLMDKANDILERYYIDRDNTYDIYLGRNEKLTNEDADSFERWRESHSPFIQGWRADPVNKARRGRGNNKVILRVPLKNTADGKSTGFYDSDYQSIMADKDLREFYFKLRSIMENAQKNFDYSLGTHPLVLPYLEETLSKQLFSKNSNIGDKGRLLYDAAMASISGKETEARDPNEEISFNPRKKRRKIQKINQGIYTVSDKQNEILKYLILEKKAEIGDGRDLTASELEVLKKQALREIGDSMDLDLLKLMKLLTSNSIMYKHKKAIESTVTILQEGFYNENKTNKGKNLKNSISFLENFLNADYYGTPVKVMSGNVSKWAGKRGILKKGNAKKVAILEGYIDELQEKQMALREFPDKNAEEIKEIQEELKQTNKDMLNLYDKVYVSELARQFLAYSRVLGIGWNIIAGTKNLMFGQISNIQRGLQGDVFTFKGLREATNLAMYTDRVKVANIRNKVGLVGNVAQLFKNPDSSMQSTVAKEGLNKAKEILAPYQIVVAAENLNQSPIMVAMLRNRKVKDAEGNVSTLYDIIDENANVDLNYTDKNGLSGDELLIDELQEIRKVIAETHGDYTSTLQGNNNVIVQSMLMFRRWAYEMATRRFGGEFVDNVSGRKTNGIYKVSVVAGLNWIGSGLSGKEQLSKLTEEQKGALRATLVGDFAMLLLLYSIENLLESMLCDNPECKGDSVAAVMAINTLKGVQREIGFFHIYGGYYDVLTSVIPQIRTADDLRRFMMNIPAFYSDAEWATYRSGRYKGENKAWVNFWKTIPAGNQIQRVVNFGNAPTYIPKYGNLWGLALGFGERDTGVRK